MSDKKEMVLEDAVYLMDWMNRVHKGMVDAYDRYERALREGDTETRLRAWHLVGEEIENIRYAIERYEKGHVSRYRADGKRVLASAYHRKNAL